MLREDLREVLCCGDPLLRERQGVLARKALLKELMFA